MSEEDKKMALKYGYNDLIAEAECVEEYGEWLHMSLLGYNEDLLREMAEYAKAHSVM